MIILCSRIFYGLFKCLARQKNPGYVDTAVCSSVANAARGVEYYACCWRVIVMLTRYSQLSARALAHIILRHKAAENRQLCQHVRAVYVHRMSPTTLRWCCYFIINSLGVVVSTRTHDDKVTTDLMTFVANCARLVVMCCANRCGEDGKMLSSGHPRTRTRTGKTT